MHIQTQRAGQAAHGKSTLWGGGRRSNSSNVVMMMQGASAGLPPQPLRLCLWMCQPRVLLLMLPFLLLVSTPPPSCLLLIRQTRATRILTKSVCEPASEGNCIKMGKGRPQPRSYNTCLVIIESQQIACNPFVVPLPALQPSAASVTSPCLRGRFLPAAAKNLARPTKNRWVQSLLLFVTLGFVASGPFLNATSSEARGERRGRDIAASPG